MNPLLEAQQALVDHVLRASPIGRSAQALPGVELARGLQAYRGNVQALSGRALASVFTRLAEHLGEDDFAALAWSFWRTCPPERGDLAQWGEALEGFLMERAGAESGLPGLARLDWALHRAEHAADAELDVDSLQWLGTQAPESLRLCLRPGTRCLSLEPEAQALLGDSAAGAVIVWREGWRGTWAALSAPAAAFVQALLQGSSLQQALEQAEVKGLAAGIDFDFSEWLQEALRRTWLVSAELLNPSPDIKDPT